MSNVPSRIKVTIVPKMHLIDAIKENRYETIRVMAKESCIYTPDNRFVTPLHHALTVGNQYVIDLLLTGYERDYEVIKKIGIVPGRNVYVAFTNDQIEKIKTIAGTNNSEEGNHSPDTVLLYNNTKPEAVQVTFKADDMSLKRSISRNGFFNVNPPNSITMNYLCWAAQNKKISIFKRLLAMNADYTLKVEGNTCLHIAASKGCLEIVEELLKIDNLELNTRGSDCAVPLIKAAESGNIHVFNVILHTMTKNMTYQQASRFILLNNYFHYVEALQYTILHSFHGIMDRLLQIGVNPRVLSPISGYTSALWAVACGNTRAVSIFSRCGIDWTDTDIYNRDAIEIARQMGHLQIAHFLKEVLRPA